MPQRNMGETWLTPVRIQTFQGKTTKQVAVTNITNTHIASQHLRLHKY